MIVRVRPYPTPRTSFSVTSSDTSAVAVCASAVRRCTSVASPVSTATTCRRSYARRSGDEFHHARWSANQAADATAPGCTHLDHRAALLLPRLLDGTDRVQDRSDRCCQHTALHLQAHAQ